MAEDAHTGQGRGRGSPCPGAGLEGARVRPASRRSGGGTVSWPRGRWLCTCSRLENKTYFSDGLVPACRPGMGQGGGDTGSPGWPRALNPAPAAAL